MKRLGLDTLLGGGVLLIMVMLVLQLMNKVEASARVIYIGAPLLLAIHVVALLVSPREK